MLEDVNIKKNLKLNLFFASWVSFLLYPEIVYIITSASHKVIVENEGFKPGTSAPEVWRATNELPHRRFYQTVLAEINVCG